MKSQSLLNLLGTLQRELIALSAWAEIPPPEEAFLSVQPFAYDTMSLPEWIQFIFIPKMQMLVEQGSPLPQRCGITPMAEEFFKSSGKDISELLLILKQIDQELGGLAEN